MRCCTLIWIFILICAIATLPENLQISPGVAAGDDVEHMEANVTTAKQMVDSNPLLVILDVQETPDYLAGHIRNAISIPLSELEERIGELDPDRETLVYAESGYGSSEATNILTENGFINIYDMCCGIRGWSDAGYPVYKKYPSVMAAVNGVPVGASVFLSSGTYNGDFTINKTISLIGENRTSTIVEDSAYGACINVSSDGTLISSLTIRGGDIGIISFSGSRNEFSNCTFTDLKTAVSLYSSTYGVLRNNIMFESGLSVEGNLLEHWSTHSVDGTNMVNGKPLYYATQLTHMEISDDSGQIILVNCSNVSISNRDFNSNNIGITLGFSSNIQINKNTFYSNGNHGISLYRSNNNIIIYNTFESNGDQGIYLENSSHNTIKQNLIKDNGGYGVSQVRGYNNNIFNNTFIRNNDGRIQAFDGSDNSSWYDGVYGNYWSDYSQKYPDALNDTRVWDTPYLTNGPAGASDRYPAVAPTVALSSYPVTDAGPDINAAQNTVVIFDGSHSFDSLGINNFTWNFHYGNKQMVLYGITPTYIFHLAGIYSVSLNVTNSLGLSDEDIVIVTITDVEPPIADAGEDIIIDQYTLFVFEGKNCSDNIGVVNYTWSFIYVKNKVVLRGSTASFRFHAAGQYNVTLKIFDARGNWNTDQIQVSVKDIIPPIANAGDDQKLPQGTNHVFSGLESHDDSEIINYSWSFHYDGRAILLFGDSPTFLFHHPGEYLVILNVTDMFGHNGIDLINISVFDIHPPLARAGKDIFIQQHNRLVFNGSDSSDNLGIANFSWSFSYEGHNITLFGASVSFIFDHPGNYTVILKVKDDQGLQDVDFLYVNVEKEDEIPSVDIWIYFVIGLIILICLLLVVMNVKRRGKPSNSMLVKNKDKETSDNS